MRTRLCILIATLVLGLLGAPARAAATLVPVTGFGSNPGALRMFTYVPDGLPAGRPLVVVLHGCTQSAADYYANSGWAKYADAYRVALVFAEQTTANNPLRCFNWFTAAAVKRGQGEALSIRQMAGHAVSRYGSDPARVYVTGLSAGGAMTTVMLAAYPDVFAGGGIVAGLSYSCGVICQYIAQPKTPAQWGDAVRAAYPGYTGRRPRVAIWHGTGDRTVIPVNATQLRDQWTNVHGIPQNPVSTGTLKAGTVRETYAGGLVELNRVPNLGHGTPVDPGAGADQCGTAGAYYLASICSSFHIAQFWGLS